MANDDLITRLEQKAHRIELEAFSGDYEASRREATAQMASLLREAANEIKRLQAERDLLKADFEGLWKAYESIGYERRERS